MSTPTRLSLCINMGNSAVTQFSNYDFNSFCEINGTILAANESGIYTLDDSDTDNGTDISAFIETPNTDFGARFRKNLSRAYIGYESTGQLKLTLTPDEIESDADEYMVPNEIPMDLLGGFHEDFIDLGAFKFGRYWKAKIENTDGCYFAIDSLSVACPKLKDDITRLARVLPFFNGSGGLNNRIVPTRIAYDLKTGMVDLAATSNVVIDDTGMIARREGFTLRTAGNYHSLQSDGVNAYVINESVGSGGILQKVNSDGTIQAGVVSGLTANAPLHGVFLNDLFYWNNGMQKGVASGTSWTAWTATLPVYGEITIQRQYYDPPLVKGPIWLHSGRIYMADGHYVYFSEHLQYSRFRMGNFGYMQFESDVTMGFSVNGGEQVISDSSNIWLIKGDPGSMVPDLIGLANYPAITGTLSFSNRKIGNQFTGTTEQNEAFFATERGICSVGTDGHFKNHTSERVVLPTSASGAAICIDKQGVAGRPNRFICTLNP